MLMRLRLHNYVLVDLRSHSLKAGFLTFLACILGIFSCFLSSADFLFKINFLKKFFQEYHQNVKYFGP